VSLSGASLAAKGSCTITVKVTSTAGVDNNTTGAISSTQSGPGATSNTATLTVIGPPSLTKAFGAPSIPLGGTTSLTFAITNPNPTTAIGKIGFFDSLPNGLQVSTPSGLTSNCNGSIQVSQGLITVTNASLPAGGSCTFSLNVTGATAGAKNNETSTVVSDKCESDEDDPGVCQMPGAAATATLVVVAPPAISKSFFGSYLLAGTSTSLTFTVTNPGRTAWPRTGWRSPIHCLRVWSSPLPME
jgi:hypothetical protein